MAKFSELIDKVINHIYIDRTDNTKISFQCTTGELYEMYHRQDCCESVYIKDIDGDINDLLNSPVLIAEEVTDSHNGDEDDCDSYTWTFYKIETIKGGATISWYGSSNGYYSERVDFELVTEEEED